MRMLVMLREIPEETKRSRIRICNDLNISERSYFLIKQKLRFTGRYCEHWRLLNAERCDKCRK